MSARLDLSEIVILAPTHEVGAFACGGSEQDDFIRNRAREEQARGLSQVYVSVNTSNEVLAYFTLSPVTVRVVPALLAALGLTQVSYPGLGGFLLGQLGVHTSISRRGVGKSLVMSAAQIARTESQVVGGSFVAVDPQDEDLVNWYADLGFERLAPERRRMVLPFSRVP